MFNDEVDRCGPDVDIRALRKRFQATLTEAEGKILAACPPDPRVEEDLKVWRVG